MDEEKKRETTVRYFGNLFSGIKKVVCVKNNDPGLLEAKRYLKEAMATRGREESARPGKQSNTFRVGRTLKLEDE